MSRTAPLLVLALLVLSTVPLALHAQETVTQSGSDLEILDPKGDVSPYGLLGDDPTPVGEVYDHVDVERIVIGAETPDTFTVTFDLAGRSEPKAIATEAVALNDVSCYLRWTYDGKDEVEYRVGVHAGNFLDAPGGDLSLYPQLNRIDRSDGDYRWDYWYPEDGAFTFEWDAAEHSFTWVVAKAFTPLRADGEPPAKGVTLTPVYAACGTDVAFFGSLQDRVMTEGQTFRFTDPGAGSVVKMRFGGPETKIGTTGIVPGDAVVLPLYVLNTDDSRKIVTLTAAAIAPDGTTLPWELTVAPRLDLKAGESRALKLVAKAPADVAAGATARLQVDLEVLGVTAPARASLPAKVVPVLGPDLDTYRFFSMKRDASPTADIWPGMFGPNDRVTMSLLDSVPGFAQDPVLVRPFTGGSSYGMLDPLGKEVRLDPEGFAELTVDIQSDHDASVDMGFEFYIDELVAAWFGEVPTGVSTLKLPILSERMSFPAGTQVEFYIYRSMGFDDGVEARLDPATSSFRLPLLPIAEQELQLTDGRFLPTLALAPGEDKEAYLNAGKIYAYELVLANEGVETDDLTLSARAVNATGWDVQLVPGRSFRVPAGNATMFGVELVPPASAVEGDKVEIVVEAVSKHDPAARATMRLGAVVTGLDLPEKRYGVKEGQLPPLEEAKEASAPTLVALTGLALVALALARRR
ncbi:MAG: hypothetical protein KY455_10745 [Euryarchaeota archaeon]|nr:hypothetical protein [Euryarchaeota archaeon]